MGEGLSAEYAQCPVPECDGGYVRLPEVYEETNYGHAEKFVRFIDGTCGECRGFGRVRIPPGASADE